MRYKKRGSIVGHRFSEKCQCSVPFRSSYEDRYMRCLDEDKSVIEWKYEPVKISYHQNIVDLSNSPDNRRTYTPDFVVKFANGTTKIIEVKAENRLTAKNTLKKKRLAEQYCALMSTRGPKWSYDLISLADIISYENSLGICLDD